MTAVVDQKRGRKGPNLIHSRNTFTGSMLSIFLLACLHVTGNAQALSYDGQIFEVLKHRKSSIDVSTIRVPNSDRQKKMLRLELDTGITITTMIEIEAGDIRDMKIGDADNDGEDEIVFVNKTDLFVIERKQGRFLVDVAKTTSIYGPDRKGPPHVVVPSVDSPYVMPVSDSEKDAGRLAIGDVNNDGLNEIVLTRTFLRPFEFVTTIPQYIAITDILQWQEDHFEVVEAIIGGDYRAGIFIEDIDGDNFNELIIGGASIYIFKSVDPSNVAPPEGADRWSYRALNHGFEILGFIDAGINDGDQTIAVEKVGETIFLAQCPRWDLGKDFIRKVGSIRTFRLDPEVIATGGVTVGNRKRFDLDDFEEIGQAIHLPISRFKDTKMPIVLIKTLVLGDIDSDGRIDVVVNFQDHTKIYEIE